MMLIYHPCYMAELYDGKWQMWDGCLYYCNPCAAAVGHLFRAKAIIQLAWHQLQLSDLVCGIDSRSRRINKDFETSLFRLTEKIFMCDILKHQEDQKRNFWQNKSA